MPPVRSHPGSVAATLLTAALLFRSSPAPRPAEPGRWKLGAWFAVLFLTGPAIRGIAAVVQELLHHQ